jgi:hypothetical protein
LSGEPPETLISEPARGTSTIEATRSRNVPALQAGLGQALIDTLDLVRELLAALLEALAPALERDEACRDLAVSCGVGEDRFELGDPAVALGRVSGGHVG